MKQSGVILVISAVTRTYYGKYKACVVCPSIWKVIWPFGSRPT